MTTFGLPFKETSRDCVEYLTLSRWHSNSWEYHVQSKQNNHDLLPHLLGKHGDIPSNVTSPDHICQRCRLGTYLPIHVGFVL